jgi:hypothetical protein
VSKTNKCTSPRIAQTLRNRRLSNASSAFIAVAALLRVTTQIGKSSGGCSNQEAHVNPGLLRCRSGNSDRQAYRHRLQILAKVRHKPNHIIELREQE